MEGLKKQWIESLERRAREVTGAVKERVEATAQRMADARVPIRDGIAPQAGAAPSAQPSGPIVPNASGQVPQAYEEPPVVARMIIEIRSDGTRTIARGALEDVLSDERVKIEASGGSPMQLAASLASNLLSTPFMLGRAANAVIKNRLGRGNKRD
ncbi:MAG TPA: hypothetical protein VMG12_35835 [Polyangiaceae bacterium]|nr:hypothetical protein [Polyangiaceae bacterium]